MTAALRHPCPGCPGWRMGRERRAVRGSGWPRSRPRRAGREGLGPRRRSRDPKGRRPEGRTTASTWAGRAIIPTRTRDAEPETTRDCLDKGWMPGTNGQAAGPRSPIFATPILTGRNLRGFDFTDADLKRAKLGKANLRNATFSNAYLRRADLTGADLTAGRACGRPIVGTLCYTAPYSKMRI